MLLLHHDHHKWIPGRTRTDECEFTKLALSLLKAQGLEKWCSHVDLHHEPPPSQSGVQN